MTRERWIKLAIIVVIGALYMICIYPSAVKWVGGSPFEALKVPGEYHKAMSVELPDDQKPNIMDLFPPLCKGVLRAI